MRCTKPAPDVAIIALSVSANRIFGLLSGVNNVRPWNLAPKISMSLTGKGLAYVDKLHWNAHHEGHELVAQVEAYKKRYGYYPEVVITDTLYGSRGNRSYL